MNSPYFSLVMPAYNCKDSVGLTIESILSQTFRDFELIIINDGSQDGTEKVIQDYLQKDSRIQLQTIPNGGPGNARNKGIQLAKGKYLFLVDADDRLEKNNLQLRAQILDEYQPDLLVGSYETKVYDNETLVDTKQTLATEMYLGDKDAFLQQVYPLMDKQLMYVIWNKVYRLDIVKEYGVVFPPYRSCEDRIFNLQYFEHVQSCYVTSEIVYHYSFDGKNSLTNKYFANKFDTFKEFYERAVALYPKDERGFSALFLKGTMSCFMPLHGSSCPLNNAEKKKYIKNVLQDSSLKHAANESDISGLFKKVMKSLFSIRITLFHYVVSWFLYKISIINPKTIEKLKGKF